MRKKIIVILTGLILLISNSCFCFEKGEERFYVAVKAYSDGFYDASLSLLEKFLKEYPDSPLFYEAQLYIAKCHFNNEDYPKALTVLNKLETNKYLHELLEEVYYWLATIHFKGKNFTKSLEYAEKIISHYPSSKFKLWSYYLIANNNLALGNEDEAIELLRSIIDESEDTDLIDSTYLKLIKYCFDNRKNSLLKSSGLQYLKDFPNGSLRAQAFFYLGEGAYAEGDYALAVDNHKRALLERPSIQLEDLINQGLGFSYIEIDNKMEAKLNIDKIRDKELRLFSQGVFYFRSSNHIEALDTFDIFIRTYPQSKFIPIIYLNKADLLYEMGRLNDSIFAYRDILSRFDEKEQANVINKAKYGLSWCYLKSGKFKEAIEGFESAFEATDNVLVKISAQIQIADTYLETAQYDQALDVYNEIIKSYPNTIYADYIQFQIGVTFLRKKDLKSASLALRNLAKKFPDSKLLPQSQYYLAVSYFSKEDYSESKNLLEDFIEKFPQNSYIYKARYLYGKCFFNEGNFLKALELFKSISGKNKDKDIEEFIYIDIGNTYFNLEMNVDAKKTWNSFLELYPESEYRPSVGLYLGGLEEKEGNYADAEKHYLRIVNEFGNDSWGNEALLSLGHLYWSIGDLDKAKDYFSKLVETHSALAIKGKLYLAEILAQKGRSVEALKIYNELINSSSPIAKIALVNKANLLKEMKDHRQAINFFKKAIDEGIDSPDIIFSYSTSLEKVGRSKEAIDEYFKIIYMFSPDSGQQYSKDAQYYQTRSYFRIARIYEKEANFTEAKKIYQKIIDLGVKESKIAAARLEKLKSVR